jgi:hypothetical protein
MSLLLRLSWTKTFASSRCFLRRCSSLDFICGREPSKMKIGVMLYLSKENNFLLKYFKHGVMSIFSLNIDTPNVYMQRCSHEFPSIAAFWFWYSRKNRFVDIDFNVLSKL